MACATTPPTAASANQRSQRRSSLSQIQRACRINKTPKLPARTRCENSYRSPPCSVPRGGISFPCEVGQSDTDSAASLEVTSAPATNSRIVQRRTNTENRCNKGRKVVVIAQLVNLKV